MGSLAGCTLFAVSACYLYTQFNYDFVNEPSDMRSEQAIVYAIYFFFAFGVPGLVYALWSGFGWAGRVEFFRRGLWWTAVTAGLGLGLWGFWIEPASLRVSEQRLSVASWPRACDGLRIAVLADLHIGSPYNGLDQLREVVARTQAAHPDLILLPGDFVIHGVIGGEFQPPEAAAEILRELHAPAGVFAVLGNHDWITGAARVQSALEQRGIPVLEDRGVELNHLLNGGNCRLNLVGVSDFWEGPHDVATALASVSAAVPVLVFTHNPDLFPEIPAEVVFTIAGHTHGGQVYLPGVGRPVVPSQYGQRYAVGHIEESGKHMYVSSGVGTSILPVRFLVPPEITVLELYKGEVK